MNSWTRRHWRPCLIFHLIAAACIFLSAGTAPAESLEAELCDNVDLISASFRKIADLPAGAEGFTVAVQNGQQDDLRVRAAWEVMEVESWPPGQVIAEKTIFLAGKETGFITFRAPAEGLQVGTYRIRLSAEGRDETLLEFAVVPKASPAPNDTRDSGETVTEALDRVFSTTEGPETAAAGIEVVNQFFDASLESPPKNASKESPYAESSRAQKILPPPTTGGTMKSSAPAAIPDPLQPAAGKDHPLAIPTPASETAQDISLRQYGPLELAVTGRVDAMKSPLETPDEFAATDERIYLVMRSLDPEVRDLVRVRFLADKVEGMEPGKTVAETDVVLKVNAWNTAQFLPPYGGFWPGTYRAVVERNGGLLAEASFSITSPVSPAELVDAIPPVAGINIAAGDLGGKVESATSEANRNSWAKEGAADGYGYGGGDCKPSCGWASADRKFPQELVFSFFSGRRAAIKGVILDTESCTGGESCIQSMPRLVDILVSEGEDAGFTLAATRRLRPVAGRHFIPLPGVAARFVKLAIRSNYGGIRRTQLAEVEILEDPDSPSILHDLPVDLLLPSLGGSLMRFSSERYGYEAGRILAPPSDGKVWRSADGTLPQEHTFCFRGDREVLIDFMEIDPGGDADSSSRAAEVAVLLSSEGPLSGFREAARVELPLDADTVKIPIDRKARFVELRLLANHGGPYTSLGKVRVVEGEEPGYARLLQRPAAPPAGRSFTRLPLQTVAVDYELQPGMTPEEAPELQLGKRLRSAFTDAGQRHYYRLRLPGDRRGMLDLELMGEPFLRTRLTLRNAEGKTVAEFTPTRNNTPQTVVSWLLEPGDYLLAAESMPGNLVLAWDVSGSMAGNIDLLRQAVTGFVEKVRSGEKLNLIAFNNEVKVLLDDFTNDRDKLLAAVAGTFKAEMATRLYDAVEKGISLLEESNTTGAMVVMTDGVDMGSVLKEPDFWHRLENNPVRLFTIGLGGEVKVRDPMGGLSGEHLLRHIAEATGGGYIHAHDLEQLVDIYKQIADELMAGTTCYIRPSWNTGTGMLLVETRGEYIARMTSPPRIELILDGSGSMKKKLGDATRMDIARQVLADLVRGLPDEVEVALRVYGHRIREGSPGDCRDTELVYPFARLDRELLLLEVNRIKPLGTTPIAYALEQVAEDFGETPGEKTVILVTDGKEECGGDLSRTVEELRARGLDVRLHIVGFTIDDIQIHDQMQQAATAGKGEYFPAADREGLRQAMTGTLALPYTVYDSRGNEIARGRAGQELSLTAGSYVLKFDASRAQLADQRITIAADRQTTVRLTRDGPEVGVQVISPVQ
jgi:Mg-chelatase subunit ChlD